MYLVGTIENYDLIAKFDSHPVDSIATFNSNEAVIGAGELLAKSLNRRWYSIRYNLAILFRIPTRAILNSDIVVNRAFDC